MSSTVALPAVPLAERPASPGDTVFTVGFPIPDLLGPEPKVSDGIVSANSGIGGDPRLLQITVPIQPGNSGGPLFNMRGEVVGLVVSKLNAAAVFRWTGSLPENVNFAVKVAYLLPMLPSRVRVDATGSAAPLGLRAAVERVKASVLLVVVE